MSADLVWSLTQYCLFLGVLVLLFINVIPLYSTYLPYPFALHKNISLGLIPLTARITARTPKNIAIIMKGEIARNAVATKLGEALDSEFPEIRQLFASTSDPEEWTRVWKVIKKMDIPTARAYLIGLAKSPPQPHGDPQDTRAWDNRPGS